MRTISLRSAQCGYPSTESALEAAMPFDSLKEFTASYEANPATYFAAVEFEVTAEKTEKKASAFTVHYNETLTSGRYLPNTLSDSPPLTYFPALTTSDEVMNFGNNRLIDLTSRLQRIVAVGERAKKMLQT